MKMSGTRLIEAPREEVWEKLNDPDVLQRCIPGCESLEKVSDKELTAVVAVKIGPMKARFKGDVRLEDLNPPESYRIAGSGKGGAAGSASGGANVKLDPVEGGTELSYDVDASVKGKIAQLGARLIDATAAKLANEFFDNFAAEVSPAPTVGETPPAPAAQRSGTTVAGVPAWALWTAAAIVLGAIIYFTR
jgi:carbon monoxide dehydrogenase subunit G